MNRHYLYQIIRPLAILVLVSFLLPVIRIGGFGMKLDLLFIFPLLLMVLISDNRIKQRPFFSKVFVITLLVFISMLISDTLGSIDYGGNSGLYFPTEYVNFVTKICAMYIFYYIGSYNILSSRTFLNVTTFVFLISTLFGFAQIVGLPFITGLSEIYASTENQVDKISREGGRIFSTTGNVLTWAGWSGFIMVYSIVVYRNVFVKWTMLILSAINLLFASSRGSLIAVVAALVFYFVFNAYRSGQLHRLFKYFVVSILLLVVLSWISLYFFEERVLFFVERFYTLDDAIFESGRNTQLQNVALLFNKDIWNYFLGIGKPVVDSVGLMEVEFVFILFSYGLIGLWLHYRFVYLTFAEANRQKPTIYSQMVIVGIVFYLVYSFGYFFLREIYSGLLFWSIVGYFLAKASYEE